MIRWVAVATCVLLSTDASARTWHISVDGSGEAPTIQAGIDSAAGGDTVLVGPGTYLENLSILGKDLVLKSKQGSAVTTLDGSARQETVIRLSGQTRATIVEGFTITGGAGHLRDSILMGGGAYLDSGSSAIIQANRFADNGAYYGGAIRSEERRVGKECRL